MTSHKVNADNIDDFVSKHLSNYISNGDVLIVKQKIYEKDVLKNESIINITLDNFRNHITTYDDVGCDLTYQYAISYAKSLKEKWFIQVDDDWKEIMQIKNKKVYTDRNEDEGYNLYWVVSEFEIIVPE